ncbi:hypothetical protein GGR26_002589 [Lewinella marina]|uniref:1,4-alpha-glucan branching enzyme n=1 Tax=Neolewinella marina TaxID=438751 RepID=A0A2G0CB28_9BACT|nr:hypothetical protein [Neolewinella marina]NJB86812.1 hypothetical protein [Neolewinella marina]PHK97178.1 hypothetical protein CGL56_17200 [Neolewinella marina]
MTNATTTDHDTIKAWAAKHNGVPGVVEEATTANDSRPLAIIWPENRSDAKLREISWDTFFDHFELRQLALSYDSAGMNKDHKFVSRG